MPLSVLSAFLLGQIALACGLACFFFAQHLPVRVWGQLPMMQRRLRRYSARRQRFSRVYVVVCTIVFAAGALVALTFAGVQWAHYMSAPSELPAAPAAVSDTLQNAVWLLVSQAFVLAALFRQLWRSRRILRAMALEELATQQTSQTPDAAGATNVPAGT
ncbi:MAG TPA: hypothetical protein VGR57_17245 [Ktedonobacterales bacterium]|nr:hypothetical protein [Ktedonobacterales bacterium]